MMRNLPIVSGAVVAALLAAAVPARAQGKSQEAHGKSGNSSASAPKSAKGSNGNINDRGASPPSQVAFAAPVSLSASTAATPFAWIDNADLMSEGAVWVGVSFVRWQHAGFSEVSFPVVDAAYGISPRVQVAASVPRVQANEQFAGQQGGTGTTFVTGKFGVLNGERRALKIAVAPTIEILSQAALQWMPPGEHRVQWGVPASVQLDRGVARVYGSTGYFSPGIWYAGAGVGTSLSARLAATLSLSRAWTTSALSDTFLQSSARNDISAGLSMDVAPHIGLFGSLGRTFNTDPQYGAGTTIGFGISLSADQVAWRQ